jgi:hypothetical protein
MTQSPQKDKSPPKPEAERSAPSGDDDGFAELVETVASAYFAACRKIARVINGRRSR